MMTMKPPPAEIRPCEDMSEPPHDLPPALRPLVDAILPRPDRVKRLIGLAGVVKEQGKPEWVVPLIRLAQTRADADADERGQQELRRFWNLPAWHCSILNDQARASGYETALRSLVGPDDLVLEIGTGSGILALLAARAGAGQVITCETNPYLVDVAREIIAANGCADRITVLHKSSKKLSIGEDLPRPADILLGDHFTGSFHAGGGLALYQDALGRITTPEARTLPRLGGLRLALVSCPGLAAR
jgi:type II protein arginine methyltransferase